MVRMLSLHLPSMDLIDRDFVIVLGETLAIEVAQFSIKVLILLPGSFRTRIITDEFFEDNKISDYDTMRKLAADRYAKIVGTQPGDPAKAMEILVDVVRGEGVAEGKTWPLYLPLGRDAEESIQGKSEKITSILEEWRDVIRSTDFDKE